MVGDVVIGSGSSIWFHAVLRGDVASIRVGAETNVQDGAVLHVDPGVPCVIGDRVTIGHNAIVHASIVDDDATIGMGAVVLSRCRIGAGAVVAAGAVVPEGTTVRPNMVTMGTPARERRAVSGEERARFRDGAMRYVEIGRRFRLSSHPAKES